MLYEYTKEKDKILLNYIAYEGDSLMYLAGPTAQNMPISDIENILTTERNMDIVSLIRMIVASCFFDIASAILYTVGFFASYPRIVGFHFAICNAVCASMHSVWMIVIFRHIKQIVFD